jgi:hypothetical protein
MCAHIFNILGVSYSVDCKVVLAVLQFEKPKTSRLGLEVDIAVAICCCYLFFLPSVHDTIVGECRLLLNFIPITKNKFISNVPQDHTVVANVVVWVIYIKRMLFE